MEDFFYLCTKLFEMAKLRGYSYLKRVREVNEIYDKYARLGLSNREIWRRHVWPTYAICEKTFYNYIGATLDTVDPNQLSLF